MPSLSPPEFEIRIECHQAVKRLDGLPRAYFTSEGHTTNPRVYIPGSQRKHHIFARLRWDTQIRPDGNKASDNNLRIPLDSCFASCLLVLYGSMLAGAHLDYKPGNRIVGISIFLSSMQAVAG